MNYRDTLLRNARKKRTEDSWNTYKRQKNHVNNLIKTAKSEYHKNLLEENVNKPQNFWNYIKSLFPTKSNNNVTSAKFKIDGEIVQKKNRIAEGFCSFFQSVALQLKHCHLKFKNFVWSMPAKRDLNTNAIFHFQHVSVPEVKKHLKQLKNKKSEGLDGIPVCIIKDCALELAPYITHIINLWLKSATIPAGLKTSKITPVYKDGERSNLTKPSNLGLTYYFQNPRTLRVRSTGSSP